MSRIARTPAKRSNRLALSLITAASAAAVVASMSLGSAPVAKADVTDGDAITSLVASIDAAPLSAADALVGAADPAETVNAANAFSYLIDFYFPSQFTSTGAPAGLLGLGGYVLDQYLFGPNGLLPFVDKFLDPFVLEITGTSTTETVAGAAAAAADPLTDAVSALDPSSVVGAVEPGAVVGAVEPGAVLGGLDSVVDALVNTGTLF